MKRKRFQRTTLIEILKKANLKHQQTETELACQRQLQCS